MPQARAVQAAIINGSRSATLHCLGVGETSVRTNSTGVETSLLTREALRSGARPWWSQICSLSRSRLSHPLDMQEVWWQDFCSSSKDNSKDVNWRIRVRKRSKSL